MIGDPRNHGREVTSRRKQGRALDDIPAGGVGACQPLHKGADLGVALCTHENSVTD
jgi:hypothetical protein